MITKTYTKHLYAGSAYESSDSCGSCNGAMCEWCREAFLVGEEMFFSYEEAMEYESSMKNLVFYEGDGYADTEMFFIGVDGSLWATVYVSVLGNWRQSGYVDCHCNKDNPLYEEHYRDALRGRRRFEECLCEDKCEPDCGNSCDVKRSCNNSRCYHEMKTRGRTQRRW